MHLPFPVALALKGEITAPPTAGLATEGAQPDISVLFQSFFTRAAASPEEDIAGAPDCAPDPGVLGGKTDDIGSAFQFLRDHTESDLMQRSVPQGGIEQVQALIGGNDPAEVVLAVDPAGAVPTGPIDAFSEGAEFSVAPASVVSLRAAEEFGASIPATDIRRSPDRPDTAVRLAPGPQNGLAIDGDSGRSPQALPTVMAGAGLTNPPRAVVGRDQPQSPAAPRLRSQDNNAQEKPGAELPRTATLAQIAHGSGGGSALGATARDSVTTLDQISQNNAVATPRPAESRPTPDARGVREAIAEPPATREGLQTGVRSTPAVQTNARAAPPDNGARAMCEESPVQRRHARDETMPTPGVVARGAAIIPSVQSDAARRASGPEPVAPDISAPRTAPTPRSTAAAERTTKAQAPGVQGAVFQARSVPVVNDAPSGESVALAPVEVDPDGDRLAAEPPLSDARAPSVVAGTHTIPPSARPDLARGVAVQIAEVVSAAHEGAIELKLHPEELGRVSMTLSTDGGALTVALLADRGETLDLMRRNIELLAQELRRLGYASVDFTFGNSHSGANDAGGSGRAPTVPVENDAAAPAPASEPGPSPHRSASGSGIAGIDIRL